MTPFADEKTSPVVIVSPVIDVANLVMDSAAALVPNLPKASLAVFPSFPKESMKSSAPAVLEIIQAEIFPNAFPCQPAEKAS